MQEQITAALQKLGPCAPSAIAKELGIAKVDTVGYQLRRMLAKKLLKCAGTSGDRRYALPDQKLAGSAKAPPQQRKAKRATKKTAAAPATRPAERFIPAVDATSRLIIVNGTEPIIFDEAQTTAIAELLFQHYDKG